MRYRAKSSKIKYQHSMIKGLRKLLEQIEQWEEIKSILPSRIHRTKSVQQLSLNVQYDTPSGVKCLARSSSAVQEVFIVTQNPETLKRRLEKFFQASPV